MKESYIPSAEIKWPQGNTVEVGSSVDFAYIMRKDGNFTMSPIAQKAAIENMRDEHVVKQTLLEGYDVFFAELTDILTWSYTSKGNIELHLYDPDQLEKRVRRKTDGAPIISLDPLMNQGVIEHKVSRGYYLGGEKDFGQVSRPGSDPLSTQAKNIASALNGASASVAEDDIFSGGSVIASLTQLIEQGIQIEKIIPGIQVGDPEKVHQMGIKIDPVVQYKTADGANIFDKVDLGDPRDYLLGASGLVVKLPNGEYGRAPYILPFVSTAARAGIPKEIEKQFAEKVLELSLKFFTGAQEKLGFPLLLKYMDKDFTNLMHTMYGFDINTPMDQITNWSIKNLERIWELTNAQGELQEKLEQLEMPKNIVFVDVNGTLFPDDSQDGYMSSGDVDSIKNVIASIKEKGVSVGLCSDSPLPQLVELAEKLNMDGPIVAENGNLLYNNKQKLTINALKDIEPFKEKIAQIAASINLKQEEDCIAKEFGGKPINNQESEWSFGANRETSITVFGPSDFVQKLGAELKGDKNIDIDCSPEFNYFAMHPGNNFKQNKGKTLGLLAAYGYNIVMIGNSTSDWVNPETGVQCAFVKDAKITTDIANKSAYVSDEPVISGVIDILSKIK